MNFRLRRAVVALALLVLLGMGFSLGEEVLFNAGSQGEGFSVNAQTMARAALEGTVDELLASNGAIVLSSQEDGSTPQWLAEVLPQLPPPSRVLVNQDGRTTSLHWQKEDGQVEKLADGLIAEGWRIVDSGIAGCASYIRRGGDEEWLLTSEWRSGEGLVVLVQCA